MITAITIITIACAMMAYILIQHNMQIERLEDMLTSLALTVSQNQASCAVTKAQLEKQSDFCNLLSEKIAVLENREGVDTEQIEKMLEKKWEDAISQITNFDPFEESNR